MTHEIFWDEAISYLQYLSCREPRLANELSALQAGDEEEGLEIRHETLHLNRSQSRHHCQCC